MARARNMQVLTGQIKARYPGVVIYGIGDTAHKRARSGHNEDDTPGSLSEDEDADNRPEHRAIDVMIGPKFTKANAWVLVTALVTHPANRARLLYVIFDGWIWSRSRGWAKRPHGGDPHRDHPHVSGEADNDEDTTPWQIDQPEGDDVAGLYEPYPTPNSDGETRTPAQMITDLFNIVFSGEGYGDRTWLTRELDRIEARLDRIEARPVYQITVTAELMAALGATVINNLGPVLDRIVEDAVRRVFADAADAAPPTGG